jgi:hypothetical protein
MFTFIRLIVWSLPIVGLIRARGQQPGRQPFSPERAARDLHAVGDSIEEHARTIPVEQATTLRAIGHQVEDARLRMLAWGELNGKAKTSRLKRIFGLR